MRGSAYNLPISKSDDFLLHIQQAESPVKQELQKSIVRKHSMHEGTQLAIHIQDRKKLSYHSVLNVEEQTKCSHTGNKKSLLILLAQMGYNSYMAEFIIAKDKVPLQGSLDNLLNLMIEKIDLIQAEHKKMAQCSAKFELFWKRKDPKQDKNLSLKESIVKANQVMPKEIETIEQIPSEHLENCQICLCELQVPSKTLKCHTQFCNSCIVAYLEAKISEAKVMEIYCPYENCAHTFNEKTIQNIVSEEQYQKYQEFREKKLLEQDETVRWCVRPGCGNYIRGNIFSCVVHCKCGQGICYNCRAEEHAGLTCEQAQNKYYESMMQQLVIQKCPKCRAPIQKKEGCNHMTCFQCKFQFCWICRARYTRMHFDSDNCFGCPDMQFSTIEPQPRELWKKYGGIIFEMFASILLIPFLPFIMIYFALVAPMKLCKRFNRKNYTNYDECDKFLLIILGFFTIPIFLVLEIFPGLLIFMAYKIRYD